MTNVDSKSIIPPERNIRAFHSYMVTDETDPSPKFKIAGTYAVFYTLNQAVNAKKEFEQLHPDRIYGLSRSTAFSHRGESERGYHNTVELEDISNLNEREWLRQVREAFANGLTEEAWSIKNRLEEEARDRGLDQGVNHHV